jgi:hypothetical protein
MKLRVLFIAAVSLAALSMTAQEKKAPAKAPAKGGILHPEMAPGSGTYDKPMATIGKKPDQASAWTTTTVAAGVDGKPQMGKPITVVGEVVDFSCYLQLGKHGGKHADPCGKKCLQNGQPIGLLTKDGTLYMVMAEEHDPRRDGTMDARAMAIDHIGHIVEVNGTEADVNGYKGVFVQGLSK